MQLHNKLSPCFFSHSYRFICFFAILANNSSTYNLFVPKRIFEQGFRLLKKCIYASEEKHKALCEKYKVFISKYKAHILKYVPYIFACSKCLKHSSLYEDEKTACFRGVSALLWNIYALAFGGVSEALLSTGVSLHRVRRNGRLVPCAHQHLRVRRCFW